MKKAISHQTIKIKNKRLQLVLFDCEKEGKYFVLSTKRLVDFKKRDILFSQLKFSVEATLLIHDMLRNALKDPETQNKILFQDIVNTMKTPKKITSNLDLKSDDFH